jgi:inosine-uridine nucleoside N-ribohydrolase
MTLTSNKRIPVLIDCDPGADDFFALIWAMIMHKRGYIDIVAITTSGGNVPAQSTYENVIRASMMM